MDPVTAVAAVNTSAQAVQQPSSAAFQGPSMEELTQRFRAMMEGPAPVERPPEGPSNSMLTHMMADGEDFLRQPHDKVAELRAITPYLTPVEMVAKTIEVSEAMSVSHFRLQAATTIASGANKSMQSLLKNQ